jgi:hypothetical protein
MVVAQISQASNFLHARQIDFLSAFVFGKITNGIVSECSGENKGIGLPPTLQKIITRAAIQGVSTVITVQTIIALIAE